MQRRAAGKVQGRQRRVRMAKAFGAVVRQHAQLRAQRAQRGEIIDFGAAYGRVQAALALAAVIDIPQAQAALQQPGAAPRIVLAAGLQMLRPQGLQQPPKLVLRMRVVLLLRQRCHARKTAQYQHAGRRADYGRQALQACVCAIRRGRQGSGRRRR
ncbi:hypothetical protein D3C71_1562880 [compost metagenome]